MKKIQLAQKLSLFSTKKRLHDLSYLIGFDGFTDEILSCVKKRADMATFEPITTIAEFGERILEAQNKGTNFELVLQQKKIGGNGPILASALAATGHFPTLIGTLGYPELEPLFTPLLQSCKQLFSLADSSHTDAIEFSDGKILLGKMQNIFQINEKLLLERIPEDELLSLFTDTDIFISVNWTMIPGMTAIWKYLATTILPKITPKTTPRRMFVDLADPAKRSDVDLKEALDTLYELQKFYYITLSLNELEAKRLAHLFDPKFQPYENSALSKEKIISLVSFIQSKTRLNEILIHSIKYAAIATVEEEAIVDGPFCKKPFLSTGGGDNFNAGFLSGIGFRLSLDESLLLGVATSGYYIRKGQSPTLSQLISFLRTWDRDPLELELDSQLL